MNFNLPPADVLFPIAAVVMLVLSIAAAGFSIWMLNRERKRAEKATDQLDAVTKQIYDAISDTEEAKKRVKDASKLLGGLEK